MRTGAYALAGLLVALSVLALAAALAGPAASWPFVALGTIAAFIAGGVALGLVRPSRAFAEPAALARMVGERHPPLASDLLSAVELEARRTGDAEASPDMTQAFYATVADAAGPLVVEDLIPLDRATRAVLAAVVLLLVMLLGIVAFPTALGRGLRTLFHTPTLFEGAQED